MFGRSLNFASSAYAYFIFCSLADSTGGCRAIAIATQISWILPTLHALPDDYYTKRAIQLTTNWFDDRMQRGSTIKDIFYYLVSRLLLISIVQPSL